MIISLNNFIVTVSYFFWNGSIVSLWRKVHVFSKRSQQLARFPPNGLFFACSEMELCLLARIGNGTAKVRPSRLNYQPHSQGSNCSNTSISAYNITIYHYQASNFRCIHLFQTLNYWQYICMYST